MQAGIRSAVRPALAVVIAALGAVVVSATSSRGAGEPHPLLPDLRQRGPQFVVPAPTKGGGHELVFGSRVENEGEGPLSVEASRADTQTPEMRADQVLLYSDGSTSRVSDVGVLRYVTSPDHSHWHYLDFDRYTLVAAGRSRTKRDHKTGFCLGDRYKAGPAAAFRRALPEWDEDCGRDEPELLSVAEGISPGFGDYYPPGLEGQSIKLRRRMEGRFRLVHHVNVGRRLAESNYKNNVAVAVLRISWHDRLPSVRVLATCEARRHC